MKLPSYRHFHPSIQTIHCYFRKKKNTTKLIDNWILIHERWYYLHSKWKENWKKKLFEKQTSNQIHTHFLFMSKRIQQVFCLRPNIWNVLQCAQYGWMASSIGRNNHHQWKIFNLCVPPAINHHSIEWCFR